MNMRALNLSRQISEDLDSIADAARDLFSGIENDSEEQIEDAINQFPAPKHMARTFEKLGDMLVNRPWESGRKKKNA